MAASTGAIQVILATGHSARDIFEQLHRQQMHIELKPLAIGVRVEHPQALIDQIQYSCGISGRGGGGGGGSVPAGIRVQHCKTGGRTGRVQFL